MTEPTFKIKHGFQSKSHGLTELFDGTNKMSSFMYKLEKQSRLDPDRYDPDKYVGDGFEFFVELFLKSHCYDNRVGITGYEPVESDDNGVDGTGFNMIGEKCAVQVKYRGNTMYHLTTNQDHLGNMVVDAMMKFDITKPADKNCVPRYYVVTTAKGLHYYTDNEVFKGFVKCIGIDDLKYMLDGNLSFWNMCREVVSKIDPNNK